MIIKKIKISNKKLKAFPADEQTLLILLGHLSNELALLHKLWIFTHPNAEDKDIARKVRVSQLMLVLRLYIGKLLEGWLLLEKIYFKSGLARKYDALLSKEGKEALEAIKRYFGSSNVMYKIRNSYAFHYDAAKMKPQLEMHDDEHDFFIFIEGTFANDHYNMSEEIISKGMFSGIASTEEESIKKVVQETLDVSKAIMAFTAYCMVAVFDQNLAHGEYTLEEVDIGEPPMIDDIDIPAFVRAKSREIR